MLFKNILTENLTGISSETTNKESTFKLHTVKRLLCIEGRKKIETPLFSLMQIIVQK